MMANDDGIVASIEQAIADKLAALQYGGSDVFRTAEAWLWQLDVSEGGKERFAKYSPFAFPRYMPQSSSTREGDGDLKQVLRFGVLIGREHKNPGVARIGSGSVLGVSKMRDLVIAAIDNWHPGAGFDCDQLQYKTDELELDEPTRYAIIMYFEANLIVV